MFKKIFLITACCVVVIPEKSYSLNNHETAALVVTSVAGIGTLAYYMKRESNSSVIARAKASIQMHQNILANTQNHLMQKAAMKIPYMLINGQKEYSFARDAYESELLTFQKELECIYKTLCARYNSYVKPWNWSIEMKEELGEVKSILNYINQLLYNYTLHHIISFQITCSKSIGTTIQPFESQNIKDIVGVLQQKRIIKAEIENILSLSSVLQSELSQRTSGLDIAKRDMSMESSFNTLVAQARFIDMILKYSECILNMNTEESLAKEARKLIGTASLYPIKDFVAMVDRDICNLTYKQRASEVYVQTGIELLKEMKNLILVSSEYVIERRAYEAYMEQIRQTKAAMHAARAARESVDAARRQAWAAEESNRIARERNRIEQEHNNIQHDNRDNKNNDRW